MNCGIETKRPGADAGTRGARICPLCLEKHGTILCSDRAREYWKCPNCALVYVPKRFHLARRDEKARYDLHRNSIEDKGYVGHLMRIVVPLLRKISADASGLDFGSGPVPVLARLLEKRGYAMTLYDRFYADDQTALKKKYDFLLSVETVEHFADPAAEFERFGKLVRPGGWIGIMTRTVEDEKAFANWHYRNDLTHICFYRKETFVWIARKFAWDVEFCGVDVIMYRKKEEETADGAKRAAT